MRHLSIKVAFSDILAMEFDPLLAYWMNSIYTTPRGIWRTANGGNFTDKCLFYHIFRFREVHFLYITLTVSILAFFWGKKGKAPSGWQKVTLWTVFPSFIPSTRCNSLPFFSTLHYLIGRSNSIMLTQSLKVFLRARKLHGWI